MTVLGSRAYFALGSSNGSCTSARPYRGLGFRVSGGGNQTLRRIKPFALDVCRVWLIKVFGGFELMILC